MMKTIGSGEDIAFARRMLADMIFIRMFEAKLLELCRETPPIAVGSIHLCAGQEAVPCAALAALDPDDQVIATYRGHGWAIAAGLDEVAVMAEICHRSGGVNGGRAGSAYMMAPHTRFIGENSIVGAGVTIACGVALANQRSGNGRIAIVSVGDGALNQGAVHEGIAFAAAQKLPLILVCENNDWAELTATTAIMRVERLAQRASGYGIPGVTISGSDPFAVRETFAAAAARVRSGEGPVFIECKVPRLWGHYNGDIQHYRPKSDLAEAEARDPITLLKKRMLETGTFAEADFEEMRKAQEDRVQRVAGQAIASPPPSPSTALAHVTANPTPGGPSIGGQVVEMSYIEAVNAALRAELEEDGRTLLYGEDVGKAGGIFGASRNLQRDFGAERVFDTPIAENAILGSAVGAALSGFKPIVEIMWADFLFVAIDQLINQAANIRYLTEGRSSAPMVVRVQQGVTPGSCAQHSQSVEAILAHIPGLKVALAATAEDAYSLIRAAAADPDPCVVIEARGLYKSRGEVRVGGTTEPAGLARLRREGADVAIITWGTMVGAALAAAELLDSEGIDAAVLDLRWLNPLDEAAIVRVTEAAGGRVLIVHEAVRTGGFAAEVAMRLSELAIDAPLDIRRVTTPDTRIPASPALQAALIPSAVSIAAAAKCFGRIGEPA